MTTRSVAPANFSSCSALSPGSSRARLRRTALLGAGTLLAIGCAEAPFSLHTQDNDLQTLKPTLARLQQAPVPKAPMNGSGHAMVYVFAGPERRGPKEAAPPAEVERTLIGYDLTDGSAAERAFDGGRPGEAVFVPAAGSTDESDGWYLAYVYDPARNGSDLVILDASDFGGAAVATIHLPQRVPYGFHGNWITGHS